VPLVVAPGLNTGRSRRPEPPETDIRTPTFWCPLTIRRPKPHLAT